MKFFDHNPRKISKKQFEQLSTDLEYFGDLGGIVHDLNSDQVISGNQRCRVLDLDKIQPVITEQFDTPTRTGTVARGYIEWRGEQFSYRAVRWTPEQCLAANIKANLDGGSWDFSELANWGLDADTLTGFGFDEDLLKEWQQDTFALGDMLAAEGGDAGKDTEPQISRAEELQEVWKVHLGDLWGCGEHRIICGDCTDRATVERVMAGEKAAIVTDPPYGIDVDTSWLSTLNVQRGKPACLSDDKLANDSGDLDLSWVYEYNEWIVFGFPYIARDEKYTGLLVWDKRGDGGENGLGNPVEVAASNSFNGYRLSRHVWAGYIKEAGEKRQPHPTQKPIGIIEDAINLVKNNVIFDPFLGSGTTLIACHNLNRRCRGIEIHPPYVSVCLQRFLDHTQIQPVLLERPNA